MYNKIIAGLQVLLIALLSVSLSGCGLGITAPSNQDIPAPPVEKRVDANGWSAILEAIDKSQSIDRFVMNGSVYTRERGLTHTTQVYGTVILPDQIVMSENVDGRSYYIFQDQRSSYYREDGAWRPSDRITLPNPFASLKRLQTIHPSTVYRLKDQILISFNTHVYQFEADAVPLAGVPVTKGKSIPSLYTLYIDEKTGMISKIEMESVSAIDEVGSFVTNAAIQFSSVNDGTLKVEMPPELKNQLKEGAKSK